MFHEKGKNNINSSVQLYRTEAYTSTPICINDPCLQKFEHHINVIVPCSFIIHSTPIYHIMYAPTSWKGALALPIFACIVPAIPAFNRWTMHSTCPNTYRVRKRGGSQRNIPTPRLPQFRVFRQVHLRWRRGQQVREI